MPDIEKCWAFLFYYRQKLYFRRKSFVTMKNACLLCLLLIGLFACGGEKTELVRLSGKIKGLGNDTLYLYGTDRTYDRMDTLIVEKDKFSATLTVDTLASVVLLFGDGTEYPLFLDKGNRIRITGSDDGLAALQVDGNVFNVELTAFQQELKELSSPSVKELEEKAEGFIKSHPTSLVSVYLLDKYFVQAMQPDLKRIKALAESMTGELKDRPYMQELLSRIEEEEKVEVGKTVPFFRLSNAEGKEITRSTLKGQYLLMHFWASWDSVSREQNAMFRRIYKKEQKNKDFSLIGISLDLDKDEWKETIKADTLKWEQACDFAGWNGEVVKLFAIRKLPANLLLSPNGKIEAKDLDEKAIEKRLKDIHEENEKKKAF